MRPNSPLATYFNTVVDTLGLLLYAPLVEDEARSLPSAVPLRTLPLRIYEESPCNTTVSKLANIVLEDNMIDPKWSVTARAD